MTSSYLSLGFPQNICDPFFLTFWFCLQESERKCYWFFNEKKKQAFFLRIYSSRTWPVFLVRTSRPWWRNILCTMNVSLQENPETHTRQGRHSMYSNVIPAALFSQSASPPLALSHFHSWGLQWTLLAYSTLSERPCTWQLPTNSGVPCSNLLPSSLSKLPNDVKNFWKMILKNFEFLEKKLTPPPKERILTTNEFRKHKASVSQTKHLKHLKNLNVQKINKMRTRKSEGLLQMLRYVKLHDNILLFSANIFFYEIFSELPSPS